MALSYECPDCHTRWPHSGKFSTCPECGVSCSSSRVPRALTLGEAKGRLNHLAFIRYYERHDQAREGPSPEELGAEQARQDIATMRDPANDEAPGE